eukprot:6222045-Amphidinium_carterae.1
MLGNHCLRAWSQLHRQLEADAAALFALDREGAAAAANSAEDRGRQTQNWVRQRVSALEQQLRYQQQLLR